jgi:predicted HicB family RNase H-like nuclease
MAEKQARKKSATLSLRVDKELKAAAEFAAAVDRRSLTAYIETLIESDLRARTAAMPIAPRLDTRRGR